MPRLPSGLFRSTALRLAAGLVAIFVLTMIVLFGAAYGSVRASLADTIGADLDQRLAGLEDTAGAADLAALVDAQAEATDPEEGILAFLGPDGRVTGNARLERDGDRVRLLGVEADGGYELRATRIHGGTLVVGRSREPLSDLAEIFGRLLVLGLIPTVLIALASGLLLAARADRRVRAIETALGELERGNLAVRVAEAGDATDLGRIARGLNAAAAAQEAAAQALRQVSADIAHDLRTPVQRIGVLLHRLRERVEGTSPEAVELAERAQAEAEAAVAVFQALLQIAQIEGGRRPALAPVSLAQIVGGVVDLYEPQAEDTGHSLCWRDATGGRSEMSGDRVLLQQAVVNLLENALRHTPPGTRIEVALLREGDRIVLVVADTGPGIPEHERTNVLRRLYRLERSRTTPGHGLGLSLVAAVAGVHGATLSLSDNRPGLRVALSFPARSSRPRPQSSTPAPRGDAEGARASRRSSGALVRPPRGAPPGRPPRPRERRPRSGRRCQVPRSGRARLSARGRRSGAPPPRWPRSPGRRCARTGTPPG